MVQLNRILNAYVSNDSFLSTLFFPRLFQDSSAREPGLFGGSENQRPFELNSPRVYVYNGREQSRRGIKGKRTKEGERAACSRVEGILSLEKASGVYVFWKIYLLSLGVAANSNIQRCICFNVAA